MKTLVKLRNVAYVRQQGRCFYCGCPMPLSNNLDAFAQATGLSLSLSRQLVCTAEHLKAKSEGGRDTGDNIVAACLVCNQRRHKRKTAPDPSRYKALVTQRLHKGKWHVAPIFTSLLGSCPKKESCKNLV